MIPSVFEECMKNAYEEGRKRGRNDHVADLKHHARHLMPWQASSAKKIVDEYRIGWDRK